MDSVLDLIAISQTRDAQGVAQTVETTRRIYCRVDSITRQEFYEAGRAGLNPEWRFTVFAGDYEGEQTLSYNGYRYGVYRTYRVPGTDYMELYAERKGGADRGANHSG